MTKTDLNKLTLKELKSLASNNGISGFSRMKKAELVTVISRKPSIRKTNKTLNLDSMINDSNSFIEAVDISENTNARSSGPEDYLEKYKQDYSKMKILVVSGIIGVFLLGLLCGLLGHMIHDSFSGEDIKVNETTNYELHLNLLRDWFTKDGIIYSKKGHLLQEVGLTALYQDISDEQWEEDKGMHIAYNKGVVVSDDGLSLYFNTQNEGHDFKVKYLRDSETKTVRVIQIMDVSDKEFNTIINSSKIVEKYPEEE